MNSVVSPYLLGYEQVLLLMPAMIFLAAAGLPANSVMHARGVAAYHFTAGSPCCRSSSWSFRPSKISSTR